MTIWRKRIVFASLFSCSDLPPSKLDLSGNEPCPSCFFEDKGPASVTGLADRQRRAECKLFNYLYRN